ncbi:hypothetical protein BDK51DRAFT_42838 [Blyttiomyces helicus]|uniref:Prolyl endopeptidase n=1 Tax=Blyttiomyces helicus TaxID=388810 RepID=A0A4P9VTM3_9FUNG|nr:hypothetical protein BDK51DRAFT_42838 [Blyttiomyces helicus]|eukprot:RKO82879.1 hypothetical protein BDK51DRAFT_42838 [Blyttiomyces helicus]
MTEAHLIDSHDPRHIPKVVIPREPGVEYFVDSLDVRVYCRSRPPPLFKPETRRQLIPPSPLPKNQNAIHILHSSSTRALSLSRIRATTSPPWSWSDVEEILPPATVDDVELLNGFAIARVRDGEGLPSLVCHDLKARTRREVPIAERVCEIGEAVNADRSTTKFRFLCSSPLTIKRTVEYDIVTGRCETLAVEYPDSGYAGLRVGCALQSLAVDLDSFPPPFCHFLSHICSARSPDFDRDKFVVRRVMVPSTGASVPVTLIHRSDIELNNRFAPAFGSIVLFGDPTALTVSEERKLSTRTTTKLLRSLFSSYNIGMRLSSYSGNSFEAGFRWEVLPLLDRGFVIALAHIRGGSELGSAWHDAGRMEAKANSVADLESVADYLVRERYSSPAVMTASSSSAGAVPVGEGCFRGCL